MNIKVNGKIKPGDMCTKCKSVFYTQNGVLRCACGENDARK